MEFGSCVHLAQKVKAGEYWLGELSIPYQAVERRTSLPIRFRSNGTESLGHVEAKYSALLFFERLGFEVETESAQFWDLSAKLGNDRVRIECGSTPLDRLDSLDRGANGFVVVTMPYYGSTELPAYLFTRPSSPAAEES